MKNLTDATLVRLAQSGNKRAMEQLLQRHETAALRLITRMGLSEAIVHDIVQETMLQAWLSLDRLLAPDKFRAWFCGIALNLARNHLRQQRTAHVSLESMLGGVSSAAIAASPRIDPVAKAELDELEKLVTDAVDKLPDAGRTATQLYYFDHLSVREIANVLGISESAVKSRLFKARRRLRASLSETWHDFIVPHGPLDSQSVFPKEEVMISTDELIPVIVADVVGSREDEHLVVILHDERSERILPIWIGSYEAWAIAMGILEFATPRPMTYPFVADILDVAGVQLLDVRVEALRETTFYAVARVGRDQTIEEIDARPSDALALALRVGCPIFVTQDVLEAAAIAVPETHRNRDWHGAGAEMVVDEMKAIMARPSVTSTETDKLTEQSEYEMRNALMKQLFGDG